MDELVGAKTVHSDALPEGACAGVLGVLLLGSPPGRDVHEPAR